MSTIFNREVQSLLADVTATGAGAAFEVPFGRRSFQLIGSTTAGAGTAVVKVEASNDGNNWFTIGTISLGSLAVGVTTDGFASDAPWKNIRGNVTTLTGTGAKVSLFMGVA